MEDGDETEICRHCKRDVLKKSLVLHEVHCQRHIIICPDCKEPVKKDEIESHKNEAHAFILCSECKMPFEKCALEAHKADDCPARLISCEYCEVDCKASDVEAHQETCGSRTDQCPICGHLVLVRMLKTHMALHEKKSTTSHPGHSSNPTATGHTIVKTRNLTVQKMLAAHSHVPVSKPPTGAETLVTTRANYTDAFGDLFAGENPSGFTEPENEYDDDLPKVACEICQKEVTIYELNDHERQCSQQLEKYLEADPQDQLHKQLAHSDHEHRFGSKFETRVVERSTHVAKPWANEMEESSLPCEICGTLFPLEFLELHQIACKFTETTISVPEPPFEAPYEPPFEQPFEPTPKPQMVEEDHPVEVPCEFCGVLIKVNLLDLHEAGCQRDRDHRENLMNRSANYPDDTFSRIFDGAEREKKPTKPKPINNRIENPIQREVRENALKATENRKETNPQKPIRQSAYNHIRLPDGTEILKKNNVAFKNEAFQVDVGNILGRSDRFAPTDYVRPPREVYRSPVKPVNVARSEPRPSSLTKKPNTSFKNYAYQPDPGHVLGSRSNQERSHPHTDPFHGRHIPRDEDEEAYNAAAADQPQAAYRNLFGDSNEYKGAKPKRPSYR